MKTSTKTKSKFSHRFKTLFKSLVRQRAMLIETGRSKKPEAHMRTIIDKLHLYATYSFTDLGAARFLLKRMDDIRELIPENAKKTIEEFDNLVSQANEIIQPKIPQL